MNEPSKLSDSEKLARQLEKACVALARPDPLRVLIQVNTSREPSKFGCEPAAAVPLAAFISRSCPHLQFSGLMTIGKLEAEPSPDWFQLLVDCRQQVAAAIGRPEAELSLSMGMSNDMEMAVCCNVLG